MAQQVILAQRQRRALSQAVAVEAVRARLGGPLQARLGTPQLQVEPPEPQVFLGIPSRLLYFFLSVVAEVVPYLRAALVEWAAVAGVPVLLVVLPSRLAAEAAAASL